MNLETKELKILKLTIEMSDGSHADYQEINCLKYLSSKEKSVIERIARKNEQRNKLQRITEPKTI